MFKGGTSAAGKTGAMMTGYTQYYQPCEVFCYSKSTQAAMELSRKATAYNVYVTIEGLDGVEKTISECSYVQVQKYIASGVDNASFTVEKPELWSIWGNEYTEILKPSKRAFTIYAGIPGKEIIVFRGRIISYTEIIGGEGGALNIYCNDYRVSLKRLVPVQLYYDHTRYCEIHRLSFPTFAAAGMTMTITDKDVVGLFPPVQSNLDSVTAAVSSVTQWVSSDVMSVGTASGHELIGDDIFEINDQIITYATRGFYDSSAFNTINIMGLRSGFVVTKIIRDDADIAKRGVVEAMEVLGSEYDNLVDVEASARALLALSLSGSLSLSITFNPYIVPGQLVLVNSQRFNIENTYARVKAARHQYKHGAASTALDGLEIVI